MRLALTTLAFAAVAAFSSAALAGPSVPPLDQSVTSLVEKVHGCHRGVELGPAGWHYHVGPNCRRVAASGPRYYDDRPRYYDDRPRRHSSRRVCLPKCRYVGPFKECKTECRWVSGPVDRPEW